jgi:hypothetical protein
VNALAADALGKLLETAILEDMARVGLQEIAAE